MAEGGGKGMQLVLKILGVVPRFYQRNLNVTVYWVSKLWMWLLMKVHEMSVQIDLSWEPD